MPPVAGSFARHLKTLREAAGFTQDELATISGLSVYAVSALERGERRRPHVETVRALAAAFDLSPNDRDAFLASARARHVDPPPVEDRSIAALPLPLTPLVGREADLKILQHWMADPTLRLVTLVGPGGVGKTRLCLELCAHIAQSGVRIAFAPLAAIRSADYVAGAIADVLGLGDIAGRELPRRARAACQATPTWLALDSFEHLLDASPLLVDLLAAGPSLRLLITSRAPLHVRGEREYSVGPLSLDADSARTDDVAAVRLFLQRVRDVLPDFNPTTENSPAIAAICRRLDALPLAIELAAPWVKVLGVDGLLRRLEGDGLLSTGGPRDLPERQRTMNAAVEWSYHLLEPAEQRAFRRFSVMPGPFAVEAAAEVLAGRDVALGNDEALAATADLIDKSLLIRPEMSVAGYPLYYMLHTVRSFAAIELDATGERDDAMEGLVRYCCVESALAAAGLVGDDQITWLDRVNEDLENYRAALDWLTTRHLDDEASQIAWALLLFWVIRGRAEEGLRWYTRILDIRPLSGSVEARALTGAGVMLYTQGELGRAREVLNSARAVADRERDTVVGPLALMFLGYVEYGSGNFAIARAYFDECLHGPCAQGAPGVGGSIFSGRAWVSLAEGRGAEAERLLERANASFSSAGPWFLALVLYLRALLALQRNEPVTAMMVLRESLGCILECRDNFALVYALACLAAAAAAAGHDDWAARISGVRDDVTDRTGVTMADPLMEDIVRRNREAARARIGAAAWDSASDEGRRAGVEALLGEIDRITA
jgi:predicted ATPase/transcriptional regulator with XRE-family HTH domain